MVAENLYVIAQIIHHFALYLTTEYGIVQRALDRIARIYKQYVGPD